MKKAILALPLLVLVVLFFLLSNHRVKNSEHISEPSNNASKETSVLIKVKSGMINTTKKMNQTQELESTELRSLLKQHKVTTLHSVFENRYDAKGKIKNDLPQNLDNMLGWQRIEFSSKANMDAFMKDAHQCSAIEYVQSNEPIILTPAIAPNDPSYTNNTQWHLNDPTHPAADVDAEQAWDINKGRNDVVVAILDGGVDYNHADMDPGNRSRVIAGTDTGDGDSDPLDNLPYNDPQSYAGHGTSVAGVVGAITNNASQVAGVMWNCKIMPVKMVGNSSLTISYPFGSTVVNFSATALPGDVANALDYAVNNGANVINLSYGFSSIGYPIDEIILRVPLLAQAIGNAYRNNVVVVASMGNEFQSGNPINYPAAFREYVIAVGATDQTRSKASFSSTGSHISVSAPGVGIVTTERGGGIRSVNGTSFSSPLVAGVAGLVLSQGKDRNFNLTNDDVRHILELTAVDVPSTGVGFDNDTGYGIVNANNALHLLAQPNVLYHYTSTGGTSTLLNSLSQWVLLDGRWGLAAAPYVSVDQYKITKHITFPVPFCSTPLAWVRERESISLDFGNPNLGRPQAFIKNVTTTGMDLEYAAYYVRYNILGQQINKWIPTAPASTSVSYTVVGQPNTAALGGPVVAPTTPICTSGQFAFSNLPAGTNLSWSSSNTYGLTINPTTGLATRQNNFGGTVVVSANVSGPCGVFSYPVSTIVGSPAPSFINIDATSCPEYYFDTEYKPSATSYTWQWNKEPSGVISTKTTASTSSGRIVFNSGNYRIGVTANNVCGASQFAVRLFTVSCSGGHKIAVSVSPNPASSVITVQSIASSVTGEKQVIEEVTLVDESGTVRASSNERKEIIEFATTTIPNGIYYVRARMNGAIETVRVVIRK